MKKLVRSYAGFQFAFGLLFWLPIFYEYQVRMGLSAAEILAIQSLYQIVFCFLELPTGWYADRFGYKSSLVVGAGTLILSNLLPIYFPFYIGFLIHFILIALSRSFISGASSAYLYEALHSENRVQDYKKIEGSTRSLSLVGRVIGWAGVGAMMEWHLTLPYWLTVVSAVVALYFAKTLPTFSIRIPTELKPSASVLSTALQEVRTNRLLVLIMIQGIAIFTLSRVVQVTLFQPILQSKSVPIAWHGAVMSLMTLFEALGSWRPDLTKRWVSDLNAVTVLTVILAVSMGALVWANMELTLALLCVFSVAVGLSFPVQKQVMNDAIVHPKLRATLLSVESIFDRSVSALVTFALAHYMSAGKMSGFLVQCALATVAVNLTVAYLAHKYRAARS